MGRKNPTRASYSIGKTGNSSASLNRITTFIINNTPVQPRQRLSSIPPQILLPIYDVNIVALLDYDYQLDLIIKNTIEFFTDKLPFLFTKIKFENTYYNTENTLNYLNEYYTKGYRYFILTSHSITIFEVSTWFDEHPECIGYTSLAQSAILDFPKKIYTIAPYMPYKLSLYKDQFIIPYEKIYFIYSNDPFNISLLNELKTICNEEGKTLIEINTLTDTSQITTSNINDVISNIPDNENASIYISFVTNTNTFYNSFDDSTPRISYPFFEAGIYPSIQNIESQNYFNNKLTICSTDQSNTSASYLWLAGLKHFGYNNYGFNVLNLLNIIYSNKKNIITHNVPNHSDSIIFNSVYKKNLHFSISILTYINNEFVPKYIYSLFNEEKYKTNVTSSNLLQNNIDFSISKQILIRRNAAALLELPDLDKRGLNSIDTNILQTFYYYWDNTNLFEQIPIYNTNADKNTTLELLDKLYKEDNIRIFLGFSRSTMLEYVLDWFNSHSDAIGISITSSAISLSTTIKNVYRLQIPDDFTLNVINSELNKTIQNNGKIFYVHSKNETASNDVLIYLQTTYGISNVYYYEILYDDSNLTQTDLQNFFTINNISQNDSVILYIIKSGQRQLYLDLFDNNLFIPAKQYDMLVNGFPKINSNNTSLKNLYIVLVLININSSSLFIDGLRNVGSENYQTNSLNAMNMINYFSRGLKWQTLSSYNGSLHFTEYNDIKYGSIYNYIYTTDRLFEINNIFCTDPLYNELNFYKY